MNTTPERVYISGPMSGIADHNFPAFNAAAARLRAAGLEVVNPAEINVDTALGWHECLRKDMSALAECTTLALLPGWQNSNGAHLELHVAHRLGMRIVLIDELVRPAAGEAGAGAGATDTDRAQRHAEAAERAVRIAHIAAEELVVSEGRRTYCADEYEFAVDELAADEHLRDCIDHLCWHGLAVKHEAADRTLVQLGDFTIQGVGA